MNVLEKMGLDVSVLKSIDTSKATTLRFDGYTACKFVKEVVVDLPSEVSYSEEEEVKSSSAIFGNSKKTRVSKVVQHIKEYHYTLETTWSISIYSGSLIEGKKVLKSRTCSSTLIARTKCTGDLYSEKQSFPPRDVSLTWLMQQIDASNLSSQFKVDTEDAKTTKTPRRNDAVQKSLDFADQFVDWCLSIQKFFAQTLARNALDKHNPAKPNPLPFTLESLTGVNKQYSIFNPILPLMEDASDQIATSKDITAVDSKSMLALQRSNDSSDETKATLSNSDLSKILDEHVRTLEEAINGVSKSSQPEQSESIISCSEVSIYLLSTHITELRSTFSDSMSYVEYMLETQLIAAVGKRLTSDDLDAFVTFNNARLLTPPPQPFSLAVRRGPEHYPVGLISIESIGSGNEKSNIIYSHSRQVNPDASIRIPLNAATNLELTGEQYLHGWIQNRFGESHKSHRLVARARQFSSFILVIGTMSSATTLEPKDAIIISNKDELLIPLLLDELPTAREFKDAIKSLSPEQQRFAKAYRSMQLASSVFGVSIIQIKPQLESLLGLPTNALDKEMKLTQDLMELFIEYQVPSDLLSFDGEGTVCTDQKLSNVRGHVQAVLDIIAGEKEKQLAAAKRETDMAFEQRVRRGLEESPPSEFRSVGGQHRMLKKANRAMAMDVTCSFFGPNEEIGASMARDEEYDFDVPDVSVETAQKSSIKEATFTGETGVLKPSTVGVDFTLIPRVLDTAVEKAGKETALRSTIIKTADVWMRNRQENLLTAMKEQTLHPDDLKMEMKKAFDLLDALTRSGALPIKCSQLHVVVAVTHGFEEDLMNTIIQDNVNPIEKIEMSTLLFASAICGVPARQLVKDASELRRLEEAMPLLLREEEEEVVE
eukprot:g11301.t1 g11301   contig5:555219-557969(+)